MPQGSSADLLMQKKDCLFFNFFSFHQPLHKHAQSAVVSSTSQTALELCGMKQGLLSAFRFCLFLFSHIQFCMESSMNIFSLVLATWP